MSSTSKRNLEIASAREHNLKEVSLSLPHDTFVTVTGLSGSGKSSLAFDTIYAEGQRRYIETFSPYTRQFFDKVKKPDVDFIENVRPAIAIQQRTRILNSRSTVGTLTDINDYLKILWANLAEPVCPECGKPLIRWSPNTLTAHLLEALALDKKRTFLIGSEVCSTSKRAEFLGQIERFITLGYSRYLDLKSGELKRLEEEPPAFKAKEQNRLILIIDRADAETVDKITLKDSLDQAFSLGSGNALTVNYETDGTIGEIKSYSSSYSCPDHDVRITPPRSSLFSFNHPLGACPKCNGFGKILVIDLNRCIPNPSKSIDDNAIDCWSGKGATWERKQLLKFCKEEGIPTDKPWRELKAEQRDLIIHHDSKKYMGLMSWFEYLESKKYKMHVRVFLSRYRNPVDCPECGGTRLKRDALAYKLKDKTLPEIWNIPVGDLLSWFLNIKERISITTKIPRHLEHVFQNTLSRLKFLNDLGLSYLTLERQARTLSGGETQRVNLAAALGSNLVSAHFVLDEPSVGLHARDSERLLSALRQLHAQGNSLLVVEHDPDILNRSDYTVELGPAAGERGGEIVYAGETAKWPGIKMPLQQGGDVSHKESLSIKSAKARNLKSVNFKIPLNSFVCLSGVSGSGKSTLIHEIINNDWERIKNEEKPLFVSGLEKISNAVMIDQSPLARSPRANIATYTKIWDDVRALLEATEYAKARGLSRSSFSFNVNAGRCTACDGAGFIREDMQFLSDVFIECEVCLGKRFQPTVLEVLYKGKNVHELLSMTIESCAEFFVDRPGIQESLRLLEHLGLGHLTLGHSLSELSGGEAQRLKLIPFIQKAGSERALLIFDEPTTGLHVRDVERLLELFKLLKREGHSILCVEHNLLLLSAADWIIDLGPEGGEKGGEIVFEGTPGDFIKEGKDQGSRSYTAKYLAGLHAEITGKNKADIRQRKRSVSKEAGTQQIQIKGAREHNLKNVSLNVPCDRLVALTGVSGSGKSSIAKDIIYAEGQRRYLDCLSPYARQFIKELKRPDIDDIMNVRPTVCVYQHTFQPSSLSTVATMSEVYNFLRLLYSKLGVQHCPDHPEEAISNLSPDQISARIRREHSDIVRLLAPVIKQRKGHHRNIFERAHSSEFNEVRVDGVVGNPSHWIINPLAKTKAHSIEFVIAKCNPSRVSEEALSSAVDQALSLGGGTMVLLAGDKEIVFSSDRTCPQCGRGFFKPDPEDLSFNSRRGRCPDCDGSGENAKGGVCKSCNGTRLNEIGRNIRLNGLSIFEAVSRYPSALAAFLKTLRFGSEQQAVARPVLSELESKLRTLIDMGLDYIPLARNCTTLSGGELQRLRLATAMGSPLSGVLYIFDEPSAGLHPIDNKRVLGRLRDLLERGNSVIQIEHEPDNINASDYVIDIGPGPGQQGGKVVYEGPLDKFKENSSSVTAEVLRSSGKTIRESRASEDRIEIKDATKNNLKNLSLKLPLKSLVTVVGVSGAGKSSLVHGVISEAILDGKKQGDSWFTKHGTVTPSVSIDRLLEVDQKPIGINSRSTPASYLGVWDDIRKVFAGSLEAKSRGWGPSFFSYNTGKGRCPHCKGLGEIALEMSFLAEARVPCDVCGGSRFTIDAQSVKYLNHSIDQILGMTFDEARALFVNHRKIHQTLKRACDLGLGYLTLGQPSPTLSGGESQRLKLAGELSTHRTGHTLYILDEPTTGLHRADTAKLVSALHDLASKGNSVIVIEHDSDMIVQSDWILEIGPGAGEDGGEVVFSGTPADLTKSKTLWGELIRENVDTSKSRTNKVKSRTKEQAEFGGGASGVV